MYNAGGGSSGRRRRRRSSSEDDDDTNYEHIQMELSEDSNSSGNVAVAKTHLSKIKRTGGGGNDAAASAVPQSSSTGGSRTKRNPFYADKSQKSKHIDRAASKDHSDKHTSRDRDKARERVDRSERDRGTDRDRERTERGGKERSDRNNGKDRDRDKHRRDKREGNSRDKGSKSSANDRSNSKHERHHDRDRRPNSGERHRAHSREHKDRKRTRSRSRERSYKMTQPMSRHERDMNKAEQLKKMGIDFGAGSITATNNTNCLIPGTGNMTVSSTFNIHKFSAMPTPPPIPQIVAVNPAQAAPVSALLKPAVPTSTEKPAIDLSNFTAPILISPRYTEQMQKRKLLWSNKKALMTGAGGSSVAGGHESAPVTTNKWEMTKFSQDTDGKVASKFLRLMGMKDAPKQAAESSGGSAGQPDVLKKQSEMFSTMEHQYEVARQVTHTMRGMGLGFGSQRQF